MYCGDVSSLAALYAALHRNILDVFNEYGVQIMTPRVRGRSRGAEDGGAEGLVHGAGGVPGSCPRGVAVERGGDADGAVVIESAEANAQGVHEKA